VQEVFKLLLVAILTLPSSGLRTASAAAALGPDLFTYNIAPDVSQANVDTIKTGLRIARELLELRLGGDIPEAGRARVTVRVVATGTSTNCCFVSVLPNGTEIFFDVRHRDWTQSPHVVPHDVLITGQQKIVVHEYVHAWQRELGCISALGNLTKEGMAEFLAWEAMIERGDTNRSDVLTSVLGAAQSGGGLDRSLSELQSSFDVWPGHVGYLVMDVVSRQASTGVRALRTICEGLAAGSTEPEILASGLGIGYSDLEEWYDSWRQAFLAGLPDAEFFTDFGAAIFAAILPSSRSVSPGRPATVFVTMINGGRTPAIDCGPTLLTTVPATLTFQTTDSSSNELTGTPNSRVEIAAGGSQSFLVAVTPTAPMSPTDVTLNFRCFNTASAVPVLGLNTLLLSASSTQTPDIVALAAADAGIMRLLPTTQATIGAFAVATVNVGASGLITVTADDNGVGLPLTLSLCKTDPVTGQCVSGVGSSVTAQINTGETPTFAVFGTGTAAVGFNPAVNRVFVRFKDGAGITRGSTSVAVRTL
jgi:hypothetical protein